MLTVLKHFISKKLQQRQQRLFPESVFTLLWIIRRAGRLSMEPLSTEEIVPMKTDAQLMMDHSCTLH